MNEWPPAETLQSIWWFTWTEAPVNTLGGSGAGPGPSTTSGFPFHLTWSQGPCPGETRPSKLSWGHEASREKALELEFSTDLATWSMSPADASVSGCLAGAPRECGTKRALGIPCYYATLKCFQRPWPPPPCGLPGSGSS